MRLLCRPGEVAADSYRRWRIPGCPIPLLNLQALCEMGATVGPVDTDKFASDLKDLWTKFNNLDPEAMIAASGGGGR